MSDLQVGTIFETEENGRWKIVAEDEGRCGIPEKCYLVRAIDAPNAQTGHEEWLTAERVRESATPEAEQ